MKKILITIVAIFFKVLLFAQTTQSGLIQEYREENDKRPLQGVEIEIKHAQSTVSDKKGKFMLEFRTLTPGKKVNVRRIEKLGYEIFNKEALEQWNINPEEPFTIVMVRQDVFKKIKDHYNEISSKSYAEQHAREVKRLEEERQSGKITEEELREELAQLEDWYEKQLDNIDNYVDKFSRIDLNELDTEERQIIELVKSGSIQEAISSYEEQNLLEKYEAEYNDQKVLLQANQQIEKKIAEKNQNMNLIFAKIKRQLSTYQISGAKSDFAKIDSTYAKLVKIDPNNLDICLSYLGFLTFQFQTNKALELGTHILKSEDITQSQYASCLLYLSEIFYWRKNLVEAEKHALQALEYYSEMSEEYYELLKLLGSIYTDCNEYEKAKQMYQQMLELSVCNVSRKVALLEGLAHLHTDIGEYEIAKQLRKECLQILDSLPDDTIVLAEKYFDLYTYKRWKAIVQINLGVIYYFQDNLDKAQELLVPALERIKPLAIQNPEHNNRYLYNALNILGVIRFYMNDYGQSIEYLHQATKPINDMYAKDSVVFSGEYAELLNNLGYITYVAKDYDKSLDYYNQSLSLRRKDYKRLPNLHYENELVRILLNIGLLCLDTKDYAQCIAYSYEALMHMENVYTAQPNIEERKRNYLWIIRLLALSHQYLGDDKTSLSYLDKLQKIDAKNPFFYDVQGEIFIIQGDIDKARKMWKKVLELDPNYSAVQNNTKLYEQLQAIDCNANE